jgi:hypothetical protein
MKKLLPFLTLTLFASATLAEPPAPVKGTAEQLVQQKVLAPLQKIEGKRSRFSRAMPVQVQRRVRVLDTVVETDARGRQFVRFAIDVRRDFFDEEATWESNAIVGCAYPKEREVFVRRDDAYYPASIVVGRDARVERGACQAAGELALTTGGSHERS